MDPERERIQADLRGLLAGEVRCDDIFLQAYANDASVFEIRPLGVVRPKGTADVAACVEYAVEHRLPLHARAPAQGWPASRWDRAWCWTSPTPCAACGKSMTHGYGCNRVSSWANSIANWRHSAAASDPIRPTAP